MKQNGGSATGKYLIPIGEIRKKTGEKTGNLCGGKASALGFLKKEGKREGEKEERRGEKEEKGKEKRRSEAEEKGKEEREKERVGGINIPEGACIGTAAYNEYVDKTGIRGRILLELNRKPFEEMRWEELWDLSEKIKHMFARTPFPPEMGKELEEELAGYFGEKAVAVRSSAPGEDTAKTSFAGVHASYVNVRGAEAVLRHLRLVWASLWSDSALLYRKEMGLDIFKSAMAVLIQEIVEGRISGVAFGMNPENESEGVVEAVYGLNKGLVDGTVEPDRWILDRKSGEIKGHQPAERDLGIFGTEKGTEVRELPEKLKGTPPLTPEEVRKVFNLALQVEKMFKERLKGRVEEKLERLEDQVG